MTLLARTAVTSIALLLAITACDGPGEELDGGVDASFDSGPDIDARTFRDGTVFCEEDADCDDGVACTTDTCGGNGTCTYRVDNAVCDDGVFCNGVEQCEPGVGCVAGSRQTCNDENVCTVDRCDEESKSCVYIDRDLDEDGDPDFFCPGGGDCDDTDPLVSSLVSEVCSDGLDNDCDGVVDESECGAPRYDTCDDPLDVSAGGFFVLTTDGAAPDYTVSCRSGSPRDLVATFTLTEARSVTIEAEGEFFTAGVSLRSSCADGSSELACESGFPGVVRRRSLEPGTYFVIVAANSTGEIELDVEFAEPLDPVTNDTCSTPIDVSAGGRFTGSFVEVADNYASSCSAGTSPDLAYVFTTTEAQDVEITAQAATGARLSYSVQSTCGDDASQLRCAYGDPATGILHELPAGTYYVLLEGPSSVDDDFTLDVTLSAPTPAPAGDTCGNAVELTSGTPAVGTLVDKQNDVEATCGFRYRDAIYSFTVPAGGADVSLELDTGSFANMSVRTACADPASELRCSSGNPVSQLHRGLAEGTYYVIAESGTASGFTLRYDATTPPTTVTDVSGNEDCSSAHLVPASGGLFRGDTTTMLNDLGTSTCGFGATSNDAVFRLDLTSTRRVLMSTDGSSFDTVLHVHSGSCADGGEVHCDDDGGSGSTSFLDRTLTAGTWYIVVDGFGSSSAGAYLLDVETRDP